MFQNHMAEAATSKNSSRIEKHSREQTDKLLDAKADIHKHVIHTIAIPATPLAAAAACHLRSAIMVLPLEGTPSYNRDYPSYSNPAGGKAGVVY